MSFLYRTRQLWHWDYPKVSDYGVACGRLLPRREPMPWSGGACDQLHPGKHFGALGADLQQLQSSRRNCRLQPDSLRIDLSVACFHLLDRLPRELTDAGSFEAVLKKHGAELVVHGHNHVDMVATRSWPGGAIHVVGAASASVGRAHKAEPLARYNLYSIADDAGRRAPIEVVTRGLAGPDGPVREISRRTLAAVNTLAT